MNNKNFTFRASLVCTILVMIGFLDAPYGYYQFLRLCLCGAAVITIYLTLDDLHALLHWTLGAIAVLYNPIIPVYLGDKSIWIVLNVLTLVTFWAIHIWVRKPLSCKRGTNQPSL